MKRYKKISLCFLLLFSGVFTTAVAQLDRNLLCGSGSKSWNVTDNFPKETEPSCNFPNNYSVDNSWIFSADSTFSFNPGSIKLPESNTGCRDWSAMSGYWTITNSGELALSLRMIENVEVYDLLKYSITLLTNSELRISPVSSDNNKVLVFTPVN